MKLSVIIRRSVASALLFILAWNLLLPSFHIVGWHQHTHERCIATSSLHLHPHGEMHQCFSCDLFSYHLSHEFYPWNQTVTFFFPDFSKCRPFFIAQVNNTFRNLCIIRAPPVLMLS